MKLNKEQYRAAMHRSGPMLVLAGPGSGKTHLLVERIRILIEEAKIRPENILVITFSRKAAREMQARFQRRVEYKSYPVTFGTFHAIFYNILKDFDPDANTLITEEQKNDYIKKAVLTLGVPGLCDGNDIEGISGLISSYKNFGEDFFNRSYEGGAMDESERHELKKICRIYEKMCIDTRVLDFDDMILRCRDILYKHESILKKWQSRYRYILVDEFQDINDGQYDVLRLLAGDSRNVFAVGDDDQSIYGFRAARPELMKKFLHQYLGCRQVTLTMNYRCCEKIIGAAYTVVRNNMDRIQRPMQRHLPSRSGGVVEVVNSENSEVQAAFVCDKIRELMSKCGYEGRDFAVLYRSDHCAKMFEQTAASYGIKLRISGRAGYTPKKVRIHEAYLRAKRGEASRSDWFLIMNEPPRGLSREALCNVSNDFVAAFRRYYSNDPIMLQKVYDLEKTVSQYDTGSVPDEAGDSHDAINVMTAHASKGLEFKCVFIIGLQEGLFPHQKSIKADLVEEERRLMYVAMTRAKERLYMCTIGSEHGKRISRFAREACENKLYVSGTMWLTRE
ncbi:MAG: ATP-dependent helicase [Lachnospiraceae bacterium]|nr:ATP-dependent helicase [Lachnospiraceae bacterium]